MYAMHSFLCSGLQWNGIPECQIKCLLWLMQTVKPSHLDAVDLYLTTAAIIVKTALCLFWKSYSQYTEHPLNSKNIQTAKILHVNIALLLTLPLIHFIWNNLDPSCTLSFSIQHWPIAVLLRISYPSPALSAQKVITTIIYSLLLVNMPDCVLCDFVSSCVCVCECTYKCVLILHDSTWLTSHWSNYLRPRTP